MYHAGINNSNNNDDDDDDDDDYKNNNNIICSLILNYTEGVDMIRANGVEMGYEDDFRYDLLIVKNFSVIHVNLILLPLCKMSFSVCSITNRKMFLRQSIPESMHLFPLSTLSLL